MRPTATTAETAHETSATLGEAGASDSTTKGSVTRWIEELKAGESEAARQLWHRYFRRLVGLARARLRRRRKPLIFADEEDAAQSAFHSLCEGAAAGRFDQLGDRDDLWKLLVVITARKVADLNALADRKKRGGDRVIGEHAMAVEGQTGEVSPWEEIAGTDPTPEFAAMLAEEFTNRLDSLGKEELKRVALLRMQGYSNEEIKAELGLALRTVARRLETIRAIWEAETASPATDEKASGSG